MARKVIIDCDPGIDDAIALCMALFEPTIDILAITATEGCVDAERATSNLQLILHAIDPPKYPQIGGASPAENRPAVDTRYLHGDNGLGNIDFGEAASLHNRQSSSKVIHDIVRANPGEVTILALGPLTNIASAFQRDPSLAEEVDRIVMMGGSVNCIGNVTAAAEFNLYYDPIAADIVFRSRTTKTLIPLDVTRQVVMGMDFMDQLPETYTNVGLFLKRVLPFFFRAFRERMGMEGIVLNDAIAYLSLIHPEIVETQPFYGQVESAGELTRGVSIFDRRPNPDIRANMEVATSIKVELTRSWLQKDLYRSGKE